MTFELDHVARLARLAVTDAERSALEADFAAILALVDGLEAGPDAEVEDAVSPSARRPDVVAAWNGAPLSTFGPDVSDGLFRVPAVLPP